MDSNRLDFLAIGAHADDVELGMGGTILKMLSDGAKGLIVDMTKASAASRGSVEDRLLEAENAAKILGLPRLNLGHADSALAVTDTEVISLVELIRKYKPRVLFTHAEDDYHPDHVATHHIVKSAWYKAGLAALQPQWPAYRPERMIHFIGPVEVPISFCVDISPFYKRKMEAVLAYKSQFHNPDSVQFGGKSQISSPEFLEFVETRNRYYGTRIRARYAEAFSCRELPEVSNPLNLSGKAY